MKSDLAIQKNVMDELRWDPRIATREIGVAEKDGVVTLTGEVSSYAEKWSAERAAERVVGVKAVASDLMVNLPTTHVRTDTELAHRIVDMFKWDVRVPDADIKVVVTKGSVELEGQVEWQFQRDAAAQTVRNILGVCGVSNRINVAPPSISAFNVSTKIADAMRRQAEMDSRRIIVQAKNQVVTLKGMVPTFAERRIAENAAWSAPGVREVHDELHVGV